MEVQVAALMVAHGAAGQGATEAAATTAAAASGAYSVVTPEAARAVALWVAAMVGRGATAAEGSVGAVLGAARVAAARAVARAAAARAAEGVPRAGNIRQPE